jgi:hypothetical protein
MEFAIYGLTSTTYYFKNKQLLTSPAPLQQPIQMLKEFFFSDGGYNETTSNLLSSTTSNLIEVWVNGAFKANINIKRMEPNCIYLKQ